MIEKHWKFLKQFKHIYVCFTIQLVLKLFFFNLKLMFLIVFFYNFNVLE